MLFYFLEFILLLNNILLWLVFPHSIIGIRCGISVSPNSDTQYSTRGGISGYALRLISPSVAKECKMLESIFSEIEGINLNSSLNRII